MKILAVLGSPKGKGAGYRIVQMLEEKMRSLGNMDFAYLFLREANLAQCTGCYACIARGEDRCPLKDDRAAIEKELLAADGVILSTPLYVLNVSWLMKNFIDRFAYRNHRPCFHRQKVLSVVNMGGDSPKAALSCLKHALGGSRVVHELGIATPLWRRTRRAIRKMERAIDAAAREFYQACLDSSLPTPPLYDLFLFLVRRKMYLACKQALSADAAWYEAKAYYYDAKINPIKRAAAGALAGLVMCAMKDRGAGDIVWPVARRD